MDCYEKHLGNIGMASPLIQTIKLESLLDASIHTQLQIDIEILRGNSSNQQQLQLITREAFVLALHCMAPLINDRRSKENQSMAD